MSHGGPRGGTTGGRLPRVIRGRYDSVMITVGRFEIVSVVTGSYRLDGGAMFGVVPKVLWAAKTPPDELNRIPLAMRTLVAVDSAAGRVVLVDTGAGRKWPPQEADRYALQTVPEVIPQALGKWGLTEAEVTDVVVGHLHFDHNGGLTEWVGRPGGTTRLRYPQARHWIHTGHWRHALNPTERDRASFLKRDTEALAAPGVLTLVNGDDPLAPFAGLRWHVSHGHTPYQLLPVFEGPEGDLMFVGDMIPTVAHLPLPWVMGYDLQPVVTLEEKRAVFRACAEQGLRLAFPHDPECGGVAVQWSDGKPAVSAVLDL